jgi:hypothetical protein
VSYVYYPKSIFKEEGGYGLKIEKFEDIKAWQKAREFVK